MTTLTLWLSMINWFLFGFCNWCWNVTKSYDTWMYFSFIEQNNNL